MRAGTIAVILAMLLAGCGNGGGGGSGATDAPTSAIVAGPTPEDTPAPPRIGPDGPEPPDVSGLVAYGNRHSDTFGGLYLDRPGGGRVVMLFTADLEEHQVAVNEILPGTQVRQVRYTEAALTALLESLDFEALEAEGIQMVSASLDTIGNRVTLDVKSNDPTVEARLELAHGGRLDVTVYPVPGEWANASEGEGWRLLASGEGSGLEAFIVRAATTAAEWDELWDAVGLEVERPAVDLSDEIVVSFGHGIGSSCPELRLDGVTIEGGVVYSETSDPLAPRACTDDLAGAAVFVVALDRDALPADGLTLRLCAECDFAEELDVTLP
jgi:hypothetical protein